jgi:hypothetical protein
VWPLCALPPQKLIISKIVSRAKSSRQLLSTKIPR